MMLVCHRLNAAGTAYEALGAIEDAHSVVWTERWQDYGEAQVRLPPTHDVAAGDLLTIPGRDMAVEVVATTETEKAMELRCRDALSVLDRRIVYPPVANDGLVRTFVSKLLQNDSIVADSGNGSRRLRPVRLGDISAIAGSAALQRSYDPVGQALLDVARASGFDPTCALQGGLLYIGARTAGGSREWGLGAGLAGYTMDEDISEFRNVAYIGGQELNGARTVGCTDERGLARNLDRKETFIDRRDLPYEAMTLEGAEQSYGTLYVDTAWIQAVFTGDSAPYTLEDVTIRDIILRTTSVDTLAPTYIGYDGDISLKSVLSASRWQALAALVPTTSASWYRTITVSLGEDVGHWDVFGDGSFKLYPSETLADVQDMYVGSESMYNRYLVQLGLQALADLQPQQAFEATLEGLAPYEDYALGDSVTILGTGQARTGTVVEIVESWDSGGYRATPGLKMDTD